jgi:hypothetical protein
LSPILDLLGVRYVIGRGAPPEGATPTIRNRDYFVLINQAALPRAFVPRRIEVIPDSSSRLRKMTASEFNPREVAYAEISVAVPPEIRGDVQVTGSDPLRVELRAAMSTAGVVALSDRWSPGWRATIDGQPTPILRIDHALRGVAAPAGDHAIVFTYAAPGLCAGLTLAGVAAMALVGWSGAEWIARRRGPTASESAVACE